MRHLKADLKQKALENSPWGTIMLRAVNNWLCLVHLIFYGLCCLHTGEGKLAEQSLLTACLPPPLCKHHLPSWAFSSAQLHGMVALNAIPPHCSHTTLSAKAWGRKSLPEFWEHCRIPGHSPSSVPGVRACTLLPPGKSSPWSTWDLQCSWEKECQSRVSLSFRCYGVCHGPFWKFRTRTRSSGLTGLLLKPTLAITLEAAEGKFYNQQLRVSLMKTRGGMGEQR